MKETNSASCCYDRDFSCVWEKIEKLKNDFENKGDMTEELLRELSDKITEIYDQEFAEEFTEIFKVLVTRVKNASKGYWDLVKKLAMIEEERDELRRELDIERKKLGILEEIHWEHVREQQ